MPTGGEMGSSKKGKQRLRNKVRSAVQGLSSNGNEFFFYEDLRRNRHLVDLNPTQISQEFRRQVRLGSIEELTGGRFRNAEGCPLPTFNFPDRPNGSTTSTTPVKNETPEVAQSSHENIIQMETPMKASLSGFSKDPKRQQRLVRVVTEAIRLKLEDDPRAEPRLTVAELIPLLQALPEDPWPRMPIQSEGANYGRCIMTMVKWIRELSKVREDPRSPWRIGLAVDAEGEGSDMVLPVSSEDQVSDDEAVVPMDEQEILEATPTEDLPQDESGVSPESDDGIDRTFDTPTPVEMPDLTDALVTDLRVQCGAGSFDFARVYTALHKWDEDAFARTTGGRERALKMFAALLKNGIIRKSSFDAMYSFVPVESDETTRLREEATQLRDKTASLEEKLEALQAELDAVRGERDKAVQRADELSARLLDTLNKLGDTQCVLKQERLDHQTTKDSLELMTASRDEAIQRAEYEERDDVLPDGDANPALLAHLHRLRSLNDHLQARLNHLLECDGDMDPFYESPVLNKPTAERVPSGDNGLVQLLQSQLATAQQQNADLMKQMTALAQQAIASSGNVAQTVGEAVASAMEQLLSRVNVRQGEQK